MDETLIRLFSEQQLVTAQLNLQLTEEHVDGIELTCLTTIPNFMGNSIHHSEYADHRAQSVQG